MSEDGENMKKRVRSEQDDGPGQNDNDGAAKENKIAKLNDNNGNATSESTSTCVNAEIIAEEKQNGSEILQSPTKESEILQESKDHSEQGENVEPNKDSEEARTIDEEKQIKPNPAENESNIVNDNAIATKETVTEETVTEEAITISEEQPVKSDSNEAREDIQATKKDISDVKSETPSSEPESSNDTNQKPDEEAAAAKQSTTETPTTPNANALLEETGNVSALYVGRVIGKGGEMIRDLQARSGCRIDVDQNVPEGAPRVITYRGTRKTIDFAKRLIEMLCSENGKEADLPLGEAFRKHLVVPANVIGKIIGRGGEMIRELQSKSQAKIQVDHTGAGGVDPTQRQVTVTGTEQSVVKAEEMINFLTANPTMDAMQALAMLIDEKSRGGSRWGQGPPYASMPNGGVGMTNSNNNNQQHQSNYSTHYGYQQHSNNSYNAPSNGYGQNPQIGGFQQQQQQQQQQQYRNHQYGGVAGTESEIFPCSKMYMGRVIGQKGATINDVQKRSGCDIQINQDVPPGVDCEITIRGARHGIESAKSMLREIIELGPNHSYAGGRGGGNHYSGGGGGNHYGGNSGGGYSTYQQQGGYDQRNQNNGYNSHQQYQPQYQPQNNMHPGQPMYNPNSGYGNQGYQPQNYAPQGMQHSGYHPQPYTNQGQQHYGGGNGGGYNPQMRAPPQMHAAPQPSPWKSATAADGQTYYYNEKTGETQWDKPPGM